MSTKNERLGLRTDSRQRSLLEAASNVEGTSLTEFVLSHATAAAENVLADRRVFMISEQAWADFETALDRRSNEIPGLRDLMKMPSVLDE